MTEPANGQWLALALILASAFIHAVVNTLVKVSGDGLITRGCMNAVACTLALPMLWFVPLPDASMLPLLTVSVLVHALYPFFLVEAYRHGDLSVVFPLVRGSVPLLAVLLAAAILNQYPEMLSLAGIVLVSLAIARLAWPGKTAAGHSGWRSTFYAALTGAVVATYTVIDAAGLRAAPSAFAYIVWLFVLDGAFVALLVVIARGRKIAPFVSRHWKASLGAGVLGTLTYGLALLAFSLGPVAEIAALRETSILFAALIGSFLLREPFGRMRIIAAIVVITGIVLMQVGR